MVNVYTQGRNLRTFNFYRQTTDVPITISASTLSYPTATVSNVAGVTSTVYRVPAGYFSLTNPVVYRRDIAFGVQDPSGKATYAIVTGAGPGSTVSGVFTPFSLKLISPRLLRDDPLLAGKRGNYTNSSNDDSFRFCRNSLTGNVLNAAESDCVVGGGSGNSFGWNFRTGFTDIVDQQISDNGFNAYGFQTGDYTFAIYNDDGWKTINGQAGKTPIATYKAKLAKLPYSFVDMVTTNTSSDKFPRVTAGSNNPSDTANALQLNTATPFTLTWVAPAVPDADVWRLTNTGEYFEGPSGTNLANNYWPALKFFTAAYPSSTALGGNFTISAKPAKLSYKDYSEFSLAFSNRNGSRIISTLVFN